MRGCDSIISNSSDKLTVWVLGYFFNTRVTIVSGSKHIASLQFHEIQAKYSTMGS